MGKFKKGHTKAGGRKKGARNKATLAFKDALVESFRQVGAVAYLVKVAKTDQRTYCGLLGRLLPAQLKAELGDVLVEVTLRDYTGLEHEVERLPLLKAPEVH